MRMLATPRHSPVIAAPLPLSERRAWTSPTTPRTSAAAPPTKGTQKPAIPAITLQPAQALPGGDSRYRLRIDSPIVSPSSARIQPNFSPSSRPGGKAGRLPRPVPPPRHAPREQPQRHPEDQVRGQGGGDERRGHLDAEHLRIGGEEHAQFQSHGQ